jgi:hypothetical protein
MYDDALLRYWVVCCIMMATTKARHKTAGSLDIIMRAARSRDCGYGKQSKVLFLSQYQ